LLLLDTFFATTPSLATTSSFDLIDISPQYFIILGVLLFLLLVPEIKKPR